MKQNRNISIDILKFFAVLLITNSHFDEQYVYCKELATGGLLVMPCSSFVPDIRCSLDVLADLMNGIRGGSGAYIQVCYP